MAGGDKGTWVGVPPSRGVRALARSRRLVRRSGLGVRSGAKCRQHRHAVNAGNIVTFRSLGCFVGTPARTPGQASLLCSWSSTFRQRHSAPPRLGLARRFKSRYLRYWRLPPLIDKASVRQTRTEDSRDGTAASAVTCSESPAVNDRALFSRRTARAFLLLSRQHHHRVGRCWATHAAERSWNTKKTHMKRNCIDTAFPWVILKIFHAYIWWVTFVLNVAITFGTPGKSRYIRNLRCCILQSNSIIMLCCIVPSCIICTFTYRKTSMYLHARILIKKYTTRIPATKWFTKRLKLITKAASHQYFVQKKKSQTF